ncbi:MAG: outer membrane lipoprotein LolB [Gammaproteobacteria bacterium]|nr:MAG: outer membrane lipoprotein LolB [Gammaproteobacteria bacterium]PIE37201.1 MAG: outer membrane lipoprotein LolB [Gammaproteobacteria bacterium]
MPALLALAMAVLLSACAGNPVVVPPPGSADDALDERRAVLAGTNAWRVAGGIGIWSDAQSQSARVNWLQRGENMRLALSAPLGAGELLLREDASGAELERNGRLIGQGASAEALLQSALALDTTIPLDEVRQWLLGLPGSASRHSLDEAGRVVSLDYTDATGRRWQARILDYRDAVTADGQTLSMPALVSARGGQWQLRLKISNWNLDLASDGAGDKPPTAPARLAIPGA